MSLIGLTAPLLIQYNILTLLFTGSSSAAQYPEPHGSHAAIDNNIAFAGRSVYLLGTEENREQKIMNINTICQEKQLPLPCLRFCWSDSFGNNCLQCEKCMRSCVNIIAAGQSPKEYGLNIDIKKTVQEVKKFLGRKKRNLHANQINQWKRSVMHLNMLLASNKDNSVFPKEDIEELRNFLRLINFERYRSRRTHIYSSQEMEFFAQLWKQNMKNDVIIV